MHHNRISQHLNRFAELRPAAGDSLPPASFFASTSSAVPSNMIFLPMTAQQAAWQAQCYQLAYRQAVAELAPPRHFRRWFSTWN